MSGWCEDESLLSCLYNFTHQACSQSQSTSDNSAFCGILSRFTANLAEAEAGAAPLWPGLRATDLQALLHAAAFMSADDDLVTWFPEHGCALLALRPHEAHIMAAADAITLLLVGLDDWSFRVHSTDHGEIEHTSESGAGTLMACGDVPADSYTPFLAHLQDLMRSAAARTGDQRSAAWGQQGHQRTPAFVHALALQALEVVNDERAGSAGEGAAAAGDVRLPRGGFTDVGLHTGGLPRSTAWPLVREVFKAVVHEVSGPHSPTPDLCQQALAHLHLWLLQRQLHLVTPTTATSLLLSVAMQMLQAAAGQAADLAAKGHDIDHFEAACRSARHTLNATAATCAQQASSDYDLPPLDAVPSPCGPGSYRCPRGRIPAVVHASRDDGDGMEEARRRAAGTLGSLPLLQGRPRAPSLLLALLRLPEMQEPSGVVVWHALCSVERELFRRAVSAEAFSPEGALPLSEVEALVEVVDEYRKVLHRRMGSAASASGMRADLLSREALVAWVAYCLVHAAASKEHPVLLRCGMGLDWEDLRHLVLSDSAACDAQLAVGTYLQGCSSTLPAFSGRDGGRAVATGRSVRPR